MNDSKNLAQKLLNELVDRTTSGVRLLRSGCLIVGFGYIKKLDYKFKNKMFAFDVWELSLFIYKSAWKLDQKNNHIIGSNDAHNHLKEKSIILENKKLVKISVMNRSFDLDIEFEQDLKLSLFTFYTSGIRCNEQWKFIPFQRKVFVAGPGSNWAYRKASEGSD